MRRTLTLLVFCLAISSQVLNAQIVTHVSPNQGFAGSPVALTLTGANTTFTTATGTELVDNTMMYTLPSTSFSALSNTVATTEFLLPSGIAPGNYFTHVIGMGNLGPFFTVLPGSGINYHYLSGNVFVDANNNCTKDVGETIVPNQYVTFESNSGNTYYTPCLSNGDYGVWVPVDTYAVSIFYPTGHLWVPSCPGIPLTNLIATAGGDSTQELNIPLRSAGPDIETSYYMPALRPGFSQNHYIRVINHDVQAVTSVDLYMTLNPVFSVTSIDSGGVFANDTIRWTNLTVPAFGITTIKVVTTLPSFTPVGSQICGSGYAEILTGGEADSLNNWSDACRVTTNSFDPNDKAVWTLAGDNADGFIEPTDSVLRYRIRFQNTGTDTAFTVIVRDTLDPKIDPASFHLKMTSHNCVVNMAPDGTLELIFPDILLVDSTTNEPDSHGFIYYEVHRRTSAGIGDTLSNSASIYFDYNQPVKTNTVHSVICPSMNTTLTEAQTGALTSQFTSTSTGAVSWFWDFGDGTYSSSPNSVMHTYSQGGVYAVCLITYNSCGRSDTTCLTVDYCTTPLTADFSSSISGLGANFTDLSTGLPGTWLWDFGDGNTSTQQNPSHTYASQGNYTVCLITTNLCGADTLCSSLSVVCPAVSAGFTHSGSLFNVSFTDGSTNSPTGWYWDFGDGNTSTQQNPTHTYAATGNYTVCLISTNACGSDSSCQTVAVTCPMPVSDFTYTTFGLATSFTDISGPNVTSWSWDFGDGNSSSVQNPSHVYATPGTYVVCLTASGVCGSHSYCDTITVSCPAPVANYSHSASGLTLNFSDQSTGGSTAWAWDFGDGNTSSLQDPSHTYTAPGIYLVCLTASSVCGSTSYCDTINVTCPAPVAGFSQSISGLSVSFTDMSSQSPTSWVWDFGDGATSTSQNPGHIYAMEGSYVVCLTASSICGSTSYCDTITISCPAPVAAFQYAGTFNAMSFTDMSSQSPTSWVWDFGDGATSTLQNPTHAYATAGTYTVCLVAGSVCGSDTTCTNIDALVAVEGALEEGPRLYPNPAEWSVRIEWPGAPVGTVDLRLRNALGQAVLSWHSDGASLRAGKELSLEGIAAGPYWLELGTESGSRVIQLRKK